MELKDYLGNEIKPGDLVIYADRYPITQSYIGKVSHITDSGRLAIQSPVSTCINPQANWSVRTYKIVDPLDFRSSAQVYRYPTTVIRYEQTNTSN